MSKGLSYSCSSETVAQIVRTMAVETVLSTVSETRSSAAHRLYCGLQQLCKRQWLRAKGCLKTQTAHSTLLWAVGSLLGLAEGAQAFANLNLART